MTATTDRTDPKQGRFTRLREAFTMFTRTQAVWIDSHLQGQLRFQAEEFADAEAWQGQIVADRDVLAALYDPDTKRCGGSSPIAFAARSQEHYFAALITVRERLRAAVGLPQVAVGLSAPVPEGS